ncbi:PAS domain S-box-containing protein [Streptomyces sp. TLI_55]|uniref:PAS domain S-box protein n=1 Tax=Streptomyces sp. TLI_55 TaxID=1938861 RepID=UPI000BD0F5FB|nr:PAS domain S-box protein [Streptomyces sp. TLI_55]SNX57619.1 PAS domain S-box-containing protein [Streptomyces sp. TLI_55]
MRPPLLSRLRAGRKLLLLVLVPVTGLLALVVRSAEDQWEAAETLRTFHAATDVAFALTDVSDAVARERITAVQAVLRPGPDTPAQRAAAERATGRALDRAADRAASWTRTDVTGVLATVGRRLQAVRTDTDTGTLSAPTVARRYAQDEDALLDAVAALESGRPTRRAGRAADAHIALLRAVEAAERERADLAVLLDTPSHPRPTAAARWSVLEDAELDVFGQNASDALRGELHGVASRAPARAVREVRDLLDAEAPETARLPSYEDWTADSGARITALRGIQDGAARELADAAAEDRHSAQTRVARDLGLALGLVVAVTALALALRRSLTRPLGEISGAARALSYGELSYDIRYAGRDEPGDLADAFRELRITTEWLAGEIRAVTTAIDRDHLDHRADVAAFDGAWAQLLAGMNGTMASYAAEHGRREKAEQELATLFELSPDPLCVCGLDGCLERVNPAFERTLGYPRDELLGRPFLSFVDERDEASVQEGLARLDEDTELTDVQNRFLRRDGTELWLRWSARLVRREGLVHIVARDVTESRRTASEQAALRRVAVLVARGAPPHEVFQTVAAAVGGLFGTAAAVLRQESDARQTVLGSALGVPEGIERATREERSHAGRKAIREMARTRLPVHVGHAAGAPIEVDGRLWGFVLVTSPSEPLLSGTETRLAGFTELVATALANADVRGQLAASRARLVAAADASRRRIERDLHDGVQQRLVALRLELRLAESLLADLVELVNVQGQVDPPGRSRASGTPPELARQLTRQLAHVGQGLDDAFQELLQVARGIHPAILSQGGLGPALRSLARRSAVPVELDLKLPPGRLPEQVEVAAYYVASECLNNAAKHAHARVVEVRAGVEDGVLELVVGDDGVGGVETGRGSGLIGLVDRVEAIGGRVELGSPPGAGTTLRARLPLDAPSTDG